MEDSTTWRARPRQRAPWPAQRERSASDPALAALDRAPPPLGLDRRLLARLQPDARRPWGPRR